MRAATSAAVFVDNHDTERNGSTLNYKDGAAYTLANVFMLAWPYGKPQIYSGFTFTTATSAPADGGGGFVTDTDCGTAGGPASTGRCPGMVGLHNAVAGHSVANWSTTATT